VIKVFPIQKTKNGESLRDSGRISYSHLRDLFSKKLNKLSFSSWDFGLHSLRAGGATAAANAKVPDRLFKRHKDGNQKMPKMAM